MQKNGRCEFSSENYIGTRMDGQIFRQIGSVILGARKIRKTVTAMCSM